VNLGDLAEWLTDNTVAWSLEVDPHRLDYETKHDYMRDKDIALDGIYYDPVILLDDHLYEARAYPVTPVGFVIVWGSTPESTLVKLCEAVGAGTRLDRFAVELMQRDPDHSGP
jgi:hypothetical protein